MARPSRTGGKASSAKAGKASPARSRKGASAPDPGAELKEAREQQAATAEILRVIASSPGDVQPVLEAVAVQTNRLVGGFTTVVWRILDDVAHLAAYTRADPAADAALKAAAFRRPLSSWQIGETIRKGQPYFVTDTELDVRSLRDLARVRGFRSILYVPMMHNREPIGVIGVTRSGPGKFADHHVKLLQTFADQAVIAIGNSRLFNETREALERQTATADILKVIASSRDDVQPVFDAIAERSNRLIGGSSTAVFSVVDDILHLMSFTSVNPAADAALKAVTDMPLSAYPVADAIRKQEVSQIADTEAKGMPAFLRDVARQRGWRSALTVPMVHEGELVGTIAVTRVEPGLFGDHHVQLLQTFADQAVIAIENARLFNEVQAKTRDLTESLDQQIATGEVLKAISHSAFDLQPVFDAIAENSVKLCHAERAFIFRFDGQFLRAVSSFNVGPEVKRFVDQNPIALGRHSISARAGLERRTVHVADVHADAEYAYAVRDVDLIRTILAVPMLKGDELVGMITIYRLEVKPFTDKQVSLVETFAAQAVIAVENTRLINELRQSLQQQTATSDVLKVISSSIGDLDPVFKAILENATNICEAQFGHMFLREGDDFRVSALRSRDAVYPDWLKLGTKLVVLDNPQGPLAQIVQTEEIVHIADLSAEQAYTDGNARMVSLVESSGARTFLGVPMFKDGELVGVIAIYRQEVRSFTGKQIDLLSNFAAQAVIAIENARLLHELRLRTSELSQSLDDLRTAQDRLVQTQKLASLGQLTAGIAHEIKNPLNFVNNFSGMSAELIGELQDIVSGLSIDPETHADIKELTDMLGANLGKIVQHGKRADAIVKSMLLHSGQSSGERRLSDINALVDESLNRAYYGERAETRGFTIKLEKSFDPAVGEVDLFPREISRAVVNLISNGFYATSKRRETEGSDYEPVLLAATRNVGDRVEIRIRDNGPGIPPDVKERMFDPFFTTKPPGEGTGLGLSITHDIIVKQHGGSIEVDTKLGEFTEVSMILPRTGALLSE